MAGQATAAAAASALRCYNALLGGPCGIAEQRPMRDGPLFRPASASLAWLPAEVDGAECQRCDGS